MKMGDEGTFDQLEEEANITRGQLRVHVPARVVFSYPCLAAPKRKEQGMLIILITLVNLALAFGVSLDGVQKGRGRGILGPSCEKYPLEYCKGVKFRPNLRR